MNIVPQDSISVCSSFDGTYVYNQELCDSIFNSQSSAAQSAVPVHNIVDDGRSSRLIEVYAHEKDVAEVVADIEASCQDESVEEDETSEEAQNKPIKAESAAVNSVIPQLALSTAINSVVPQLAVSTAINSVIPQLALSTAINSVIPQLALSTAIISMMPQLADGTTINSVVPQLAVSTTVISMIPQLATGTMISSLMPRDAVSTAVMSKIPKVAVSTPISSMIPQLAVSTAISSMIPKIAKSMELSQIVQSTRTTAMITEVSTARIKPVNEVSTSPASKIILPVEPKTSLPCSAIPGQQIQRNMDDSSVSFKRGHSLSSSFSQQDEASLVKRGKIIIDCIQQQSVS